MMDKPTKKHLGLRLRIRCHCGSCPEPHEVDLLELRVPDCVVGFSSLNDSTGLVEREHCEVLETLSAGEPT